MSASSGLKKNKVTFAISKRVDSYELHRREDVRADSKRSRKSGTRPKSRVGGGRGAGVAHAARGGVFRGARVPADRKDSGAAAGRVARGPTDGVFPAAQRGLRAEGARAQRGRGKREAHRAVSDRPAAGARGGILLLGAVDRGVRAGVQRDVVHCVENNL